MIDDPIANNLITAINKAILGRVAEKPASPLINLEDASIEAIKDYLRSKHSATWSIYSISSDDTLEKAALWFKSELSNFHSFLYLPRPATDSLSRS